MAKIARSLTRYRPVATDDLIRVGRKYDGGYVIPRRVIAATEILVGLGIETDWSFEAGFLEQNPRARLIGVDGSVSAAIFRRRAQMHLAQAALAAVRGRVSGARSRLRSAGESRRLARAFEQFFDGRDRLFVDKFLGDGDAGEWITWKSLKEIAGIPASGTPNIFVKMDIEGEEYRTLAHVLRDAPSIVGMVVEFHACDLLWERFTELMDASCEHLVVVHMHGNNMRPLIAGTPIPRVLEVSLLHRSLVSDAEVQSGRRRSYPLAELDRPNVPDLPDYTLEF